MIGDQHGGLGEELDGNHGASGRIQVELELVQLVLTQVPKRETS